MFYSAFIFIINALHLPTFMDIPILLLAFNRPDVFQELLDSLRLVKPQKIYIAVDGPRLEKPDDIEKVKAVQNAIHSIDWPCEIKTHFREVNMGCRHGITDAISWFFKQENFGIILEDDCIPNVHFFDYCREMLYHYKDDKRVFSIAGYNPVNTINFDNYAYDYWFYPTAICWGWATWADRWQYYNDSETLYNEVISNKSLLQQTDNSWFGNKYKFLVDKVIKEEITAWDYIWSYTLLLQNGLSIIPKYNFINNIGCHHPDASHTFDEQFVVTKTHFFNSEIKWKHPSYMIRNAAFEEVLKLEFFPPQLPFSKRIIPKVKSFVKKIIQ